MGRVYGKETWNPRRIIRQIVLMQVLYYLSLLASAAFLNLLIAEPFTVWTLFSHSVFASSSGPAWVAGLATCTSALIGAWCLVWVVERAKKCMDFSFTVTFWHWVATCCFEGFPTTWQWWLLQVVGLGIMAGLGEYLCMRHEMSEITVDDILRHNAARDAKESTARRAARRSRKGQSRAAAEAVELGLAGAAAAGGDGEGALAARPTFVQPTPVGSASPAAARDSRGRRLDLSGRGGRSGGRGPRGTRGSGAVGVRATRALGGEAAVRSVVV